MIVVIGGSGFVGSRLCRRLAASGRNFLIFDKSKSAAFPDRWIKGDVRDVDSLRSAIPEGATLVNLAAEHRDDVRPLSLYEDVNVGGATNICRVATERHVRKILFTSSVAVYGFASPGTGEDGEIGPFNEYGRTKARAEEVFRSWCSSLAESVSESQSLVIVRPTVIFGEGNRGNVYNLLKQVASGRFVMVGGGLNVKSMAYVENVAAFLEHALDLGPGVHLYNYVDKPDFDMNELVKLVRSKLGLGGGIGVRIPYVVGFIAGILFDGIAKATGKRFPISSIRIKKFCATTQFSTSVGSCGFVPPVSLSDGFDSTVQYEFVDDNVSGVTYFTE